MTKSLKTLSKLSAKQIEDKQKEIAKLNAVIDEMEQRQAYLNAAIVSEYAAATQTADSTLYRAAGAFELRAKAELADLKESLIDAERIMAEKREQMRELYSEQKRYDMLIERKEFEAKKEQAKKEQDALDEMGALRHTRDLRSS